MIQLARIIIYQVVADLRLAVALMGQCAREFVAPTEKGRLARFWILVLAARLPAPPSALANGAWAASRGVGRHDPTEELALMGAAAIAAADSSRAAPTIFCPTTAATTTWSIRRMIGVGCKEEQGAATIVVVGASAGVYRLQR